MSFPRRQRGLVGRHPRRPALAVLRLKLRTGRRRPHLPPTRREAQLRPGPGPAQEHGSRHARPAYARDPRYPGAENRAFPPWALYPVARGLHPSPAPGTGGRRVCRAPGRLAASPPILGDRTLWVPAMLKAFQVGVSDGKSLWTCRRVPMANCGSAHLAGRADAAGTGALPGLHCGALGAPRLRCPWPVRPQDGPGREVLAPLPARTRSGASSTGRPSSPPGGVAGGERVRRLVAVAGAGCWEVTCIDGVQGFTRDHEELFGRFATVEVRFCLDGDVAGRTATERLGGRIHGQRPAMSVSAHARQPGCPNSTLTTQGARPCRDCSKKPSRGTCRFQGHLGGSDLLHARPAPTRGPAKGERLGNTIVNLQLSGRTHPDKTKNPQRLSQCCVCFVGKSYDLAAPCWKGTTGRR